jgi:hypothetical protein
MSDVQPAVAPAAPAANASAAPAPSPAPLPSIIAETDYLRLPAEQQTRYANVRREDRSGPAEWRLRSDLPSEKPQPAQQPAQPTADKSAVQPDAVATATTKLTADQYRIEHSKSFVAPEFSYRLDPSGPLATAARDFAAKHNLSQEQFSELVDLHVAGQAKEAEMFKQAAAAEIGARTEWYSASAECAELVERHARPGRGT